MGLLRLILIPFLLTLSGCTQIMSVQDFQGAHNQEFLESTTNASPDFLKLTNISLPYQKMLIHSPWGDNVEVTVKEHYVSAAHSLCLIIPSENKTNQLVCSEDNENWQIFPKF